MSIAFYAPMKPLDDPRPSGDRTLGRLLFAALEAAGRAPFIACRFKSRDGRGDADRQARIAAIGEKLADRLVARLARRAAPPRAWLTYHLYYKAPDPIGPRVSAALGLPYVIAEASHAPARLPGPWARGAASAQRAIEQADRILTLNPVDAPALTALRGGADLVDFPPFIDARAFDGRLGAPDRSAARAALSRRIGGDAARPILLTAAMMRPGAKLRSYQALAEAYRRSRARPRLAIVGDGPARAEVEAAFAGLGAAFLGACDAEGLRARYAGADLFAWPAIEEAFGMVFLEAQAAGLPIVAGNTGAGVARMLRDGETGLLAPLAPAAFAGAIDALAEDSARRARMGAAAARFARTRDLDAAARRLDAVLAELGA